MAQLRDVVGYLCRRYPRESDLTKARLTKLVYLADWKSALDRQRQLTSIRWLFNRFGPYVDDVVESVATDPAFQITPDHTMYGNPKETVALIAPFNEASLQPADRTILDHVIDQTQQLTFESFIRLVYSTHPVLTGRRGAYMDLLGAAENYRVTEHGATRR